MRNIINKLKAMLTPEPPAPVPEPQPPEPTEPPPVEYTRVQYMAKECTHDQYYGQFVTRGVTSLVLSVIGEHRIINSKDKYFNDIPLHEWDALKDFVRMSINTKKFMRLTWPDYSGPNVVYWSTSDAVCIAKQVARMVREEVQQGESK
jgi:hypothetical protein